MLKIANNVCFSKCLCNPESQAACENSFFVRKAPTSVEETGVIGFLESDNMILVTIDMDSSVLIVDTYGWACHTEPVYLFPTIIINKT